MFRKTSPRKPSPNKQSGFALIVVMVVIAILGGIAIHFSSNMKVEMKLAQNSHYDADYEILGMSGIEYGRYILGLEASSTMSYEPFDALHQIWAGGTGSENFPQDEELMAIDMKNNPLGVGNFSLTITDLERKWNINIANEQIFENAFTIMGIDFAEMSSISGSILDWMDPDELTRPGGAESEDYLSLSPPYVCKDGPIDDIHELLRIQGITPEMFYGPQFDPSRHIKDPTLAAEYDYIAQDFAYPYGLRDFFTPISSGRVNVNTAPIQVLQMIPGIDELSAGEIVAQRAGPDGIEGTSDDTPYASPSMIPILPDFAAAASRYITVRSLHFLIEVKVTINGYSKIYEGLVRRESPAKIDILYIRKR